MKYWFGARAFIVTKKTILAAFMALMTVGTGSLTAEGRPVVVELFTSQGCSSCPPADAFLEELAMRDDVIALSLHVDYWDYIGWADTFGSPAHTARQRGYAKAHGHKMVYTPQMIVGGTDAVVGTHRAEVIDLIDKHLAQDTANITLEVARDDDTVTLRASMAQPRDTPLVVQRVCFKPQESVRIKRGENAGRTITYVNIVTGMDHLVTWDTRTPLAVQFDAAGEGASVILLQAGRHGPIAAAVRLSP